MLEKLLGLRSFGTIVDHLVHHQVTFPTSLGGLGLPLMVQHVAPIFLRCWVLIAPTLVSCFQQDDHFTFFDVVAHVKTSTYPFQVALWDIRVMLHFHLLTCFAFQKFSGAILSSNPIFFEGPTTEV